MPNRDFERTPVLFVGDSTWSEFRHVHSWLAGHAELSTVADTRAALELLGRHGFLPRLIVLAQILPGQFSSDDVARLLRAAPLARVSELLSSWCEGETRSGEPIAGSLRLYWHQWAARMAPEFSRATAGERPLWEMPLTATDEERLLDLPPPRSIGGGTLLAILARSAESAEVLCEAAAKYGFGAVWIRRNRQPLVAGIQAAIWEAPADLNAAEEELRSWQPLLRGAPVAALTDFPRIEDRDRLLAAGAAFVVSRPFWLGDLFEQLAAKMRP
jgi:hypothetical protein